MAPISCQAHERGRKSPLVHDFTAGSAPLASALGRGPSEAVPRNTAPPCCQPGQSRTPTAIAAVSNGPATRFYSFYKNSAGEILIFCGFHKRFRDETILQTFNEHIFYPIKMRLSSPSASATRLGKRFSERGLRSPGGENGSGEN